MISISNVKKFCKDDLNLIENYDKAISDTTQVWDCHHRLEIELNVSRQQLKDMGRYFNVPANELIFLTHSDHRRLHATGKQQSEVTREKRSIAMKGKPAPMKGKPAPWHAHPKSEETKRKMSEKKKGKPAPMKGKPAPWHAHPKSEETKRKISEKKKGKTSPLKGKHRVYRDDGTYYMSY